MTEKPTYEELEKRIQELEHVEYRFKRAEEALWESEDRYRAVVEDMPGLICGFLPDGEITFVNKAYGEYFGKTFDELVGTNFLHLIPESERKAVMDNISALKVESPTQSHQHTVIVPNGDIRWQRWTNRALFDDQGKTVGYQSIGMDITERKQAEEALRQERNRAQKLFDIAGVMFVAIDAKGEVSLVNQKGSAVLGYEQKEIIGKNWFGNFLPESIKDQTKSVFNRLMAGEVQPIEYYENPVLTKSGEERIIAWHNTILKDEEGRISGTLSSGEDITERKQAEEALRTSHETLLTVLDSIDATIYVADMESHEILFMNKYMIESFGRDMTGEICWDVFRGESEPCPHCTNDQLIDENGKPLGVCIWQDKNPITEKWYINHDRAIEWKDGRLVRLQIATDITDLKQMEEKLRQAHKMEAIGTLAGGIAHDFNNILSPIIGNSELAMMDIDDNSSIKLNLEEIMKAGLRAKDLVQQILTFSRHTEQQKIPIRLNIIIKEIAKLLRSTIPTTINIHYNLKAKSDTVLADPTQMHQVLLNLCTNASHAMREKGGVLEIELDDLYHKSGTVDEFTDLNPGAYLRLTVRDTGHGMEPKVIDKILEPYFTTKEIGEGTGMGLAVVHGIVKSLSGDVSVESTPGKGSSIAVLFPKYQGDILDQKEDLGLLPSGTERILFVDDEKAMIDLIKVMLERLGYKVTTRTSSIEALEAFRNKPDAFDVVITDMTMPNMTGKDLARELMTIQPDIPIILCTGFSEKVDERKADEMGISAFVMKPIFMRDIANTIRKVLDKR